NARALTGSMPGSLRPMRAGPGDCKAVPIQAVTGTTAPRPRRGASLAPMVWSSTETPQVTAARILRRALLVQAEQAGIAAGRRGVDGEGALGGEAVQAPRLAGRAAGRGPWGRCGIILRRRRAARRPRRRSCCG